MWSSGQSSWLRNGDVLCFLKLKLKLIYDRQSVRQDGSVIYCTIASGPCQSSHSWVEVPQNSRPYFTVSFETPRALGSLFVACYGSQGSSGGILTHLHTGLCFLWGTNWIYVCYVEESRPPLWSSGQSSWLHNGYVLCFLWGPNLIYICYVQESRPLLWSSGQSSWLQNGDELCFLWGTNWIYLLCRRK
jgi:hypothetical protein